jgi:hypothetical protein
VSTTDTPGCPAPPASPIFGNLAAITTPATSKFARRPVRRARKASAPIFRRPLFSSHPRRGKYKENPRQFPIGCNLGHAQNCVPPGNEKEIEFPQSCVFLEGNREFVGFNFTPKFFA